MPIDKSIKSAENYLTTHTKSKLFCFTRNLNRLAEACTMDQSE